MELVKSLKKMNLVTLEDSEMLEQCHGGVQDLLQKTCYKNNRKYSIKLRAFAHTLNFFRRKRINTRSSFNSCLPHPKVIARWYESVDGSPGFTEDDFVALRNAVMHTPYQIVCSLTLDEMAIRQHIEFDGKRYHGYINVGTTVSSNGMSQCKEALIFMLVAHNASWKIPLAYFFCNSMTGSQKYEVVRDCIERVQDTGIKIANITFDGASTNVTMAKCFGCSFNWPYIEAEFCIGSENPIQVLLDACHCLKLIRNTFGDYKVFIDREGGVIYWEFLKKLNNLQEKEGLHFANKLRRSHVLFFKQKMKVKLAAQLFIDSGLLRKCFKIGSIPRVPANYKFYPQDKH